MIAEHGNIAVLEPDVLATGQQTNPDNGTMVTSAVRGTFKESAMARAEVISMINICRR